MLTVTNCAEAWTESNWALKMPSITTNKNGHFNTYTNILIWKMMIKHEIWVVPVPHFQTNPTRQHRGIPLFFAANAGYIEHNKTIQDSRHRSGFKHKSPYYSRQEEYPKSEWNFISCPVWKTSVSNSIPQLYSTPPVLGPEFMNRSNTKPGSPQEQ